MSKVVITKVEISTNPVQTGQEFTIIVCAYEAHEEKETRRLPFRLGNENIMVNGN